MNKSKRGLRHLVDYINMALMGASMLIAFLVPWPLLIIAYAVLGPAHYLSQISWMHDKRYFTNTHYEYVPLILIAIALALILLIEDLTLPLSLPPELFQILLISALSLSFVIVCFKSTTARLLFVPLSLSLIVLVHYSPKLLLFLFLIPTVIHVYLFTAAFILSGAIKNRSIPGLISFVVLLACGSSFFYFFSTTQLEIPGPWLHSGQTYFYSIMADFMSFFNLNLTHQHLICVLKFLAFAYTYHYLNWFSKTGVIGWHHVSLKRSLLICFIYFLALALYCYDYRLGFIALGGLSLGHVILELPLDVLIFKNLAKNILCVATIKIAFFQKQN